MEIIQMKPYGRLHTNQQTYLLLNPQPVPRDSCWGSDIYTFFCATLDNFGKMVGTHVICKDFTIELLNLAAVEVHNVMDVDEVSNNWDVPSEEMVDYIKPVMDDQISPEELEEMARDYTHWDEEDSE